MSYPKAIRVVEAISTRYSDAKARNACREIKSVLLALEMLHRMPDHDVPPRLPIEDVLATAPKIELPPVAPRVPEVPKPQVVRPHRGRTTWTAAMREQLFNLIGTGIQIQQAADELGFPYATVRSQCERFPDDPRLQHLTMFRMKSRVG